MACKRCGKKSAPTSPQPTPLILTPLIMSSKGLITVARGKKGATLQMQPTAFLGKYAERLKKAFGTLQVIDIDPSITDEQVAAIVEACKQLGIDVAEKYLTGRTSTAPAPVKVDLATERLKQNEETENTEAGVPESVAADTQESTEKPKRGRKPKQTEQ